MTSAPFLDSWRDKAACQSYMIEDPDLWDSFFGDKRADRAAAAKACAKCPVRRECLRDALERGEVWGVWGGCDEVDLRRALWVDTNGTERERLRFPRCPACRAKTECLFVRATCKVSNQSVGEVVECGSCGFEWAAKTSIAAMKKFWKAEKETAPVIPITRKPRVRAPRGRIPSGTPNRKGRGVQLPGTPGSYTEVVRALVASSRPSTD